MKKTSVEILLVKAEVKGAPEKRLPVSRNLVSVDLIWPKTGTARKSAARTFAFKRGKCDFQNEIWAKRCLFREEIEGHCGIAVTIAEPMSIQKLRRFLQITAKYALREGGDIAAGLTPGFGDIAAAPFDALGSMVAEKDAPKAIAKGVIDFAVPSDSDGLVRVTVPLRRPPPFDREIGALTLEVRLG